MYLPKNFEGFHIRSRLSVPHIQLSSRSYKTRALCQNKGCFHISDGTQYDYSLTHTDKTHIRVNGSSGDNAPVALVLPKTNTVPHITPG